MSAATDFALSKYASREDRSEAMLIEIESLRAQLAEERQQLLATQAHAARLVEALDKHGTHDKGCSALAWNKNNDDVIPDAYCDCGLYSALSTPINLDALHEALARECERLNAEMNERGINHGETWEFIDSEADAHRAKKAGK